MLLSETTKVDLSRDPAYRLIYDLDYHYSYRRGNILSEHKTAEDLWQSPIIHRYFGFFGKSECDYFEDYLQKINSGGIYQLSHLYYLIYCWINERGIIKIIKPTSEDDL